MEHTLRGPMRRGGGRTHLLGGVLAVGALLTLDLAGCGVSVSGASAAPTTASATPPSAATATSTTIGAITPAPSAGWTTYRDRQFHFEVSLPPGWQPATLTWPSPHDWAIDPIGPHYYIVQFFPPGPHGEPGPGADAYAPELIEMNITLSGPSTPLASATGFFHPEPHPVALGTQQVVLYDYGMPRDGGEIGRVAQTTLGSYPMLFGMHYLAYGAWNPAIAQRDVALFLAMMQGYRSG